MSDNPRDTQFRGFARLLIDDLRRRIDPNIDNPIPYEQVIAQRAYDLVEHTLDACDILESEAGLEAHGFTSDYLLSHIPDMTTLPEEGCRE